MSALPGYLPAWAGSALGEGTKQVPGGVGERGCVPCSRPALARDEEGPAEQSDRSYDGRISDILSTARTTAGTTMSRMTSPGIAVTVATAT